MEIYRVVINFISLLISIGLVYFALRLLSIFRGGKMGKAWVYISSGAFALAIATSLFSLERILDFQISLIRPIGGTIMMIGGLLILIGMYHEYKGWAKPS